MQTRQSRRWSSAGTDGILRYEYVLTEPLSANDPEANVARAEELVRHVVDALLGGNRNP